MFKTVNYEIPKTAVLKRNTKQPQRRGFINLHVTHQPHINKANNWAMETPTIAQFRSTTTHFYA